MPAGRRATLGTAALGVLAAAAAWGVAAALTAEPKLALAAPLFVVAATVCLRWPAEGLIGVLALTGFSGSVSAFTDISAAPVADLILLGLWAAVIWGHLAGGGRGTAWLWPGVVACGLYLGLTMIEILAAPDPELALSSFRIGAWYMLAMLLVAYAPWPPRTYLRIARGAVLVALAVGSYAVLRKLIGSAAAEQANAIEILSPGAKEELRFFGSLVSAQALAAWCGLYGDLLLRADDGRARRLAPRCRVGGGPLPGRGDPLRSARGPGGNGRRVRARRDLGPAGADTDGGQACGGADRGGGAGGDGGRPDRRRRRFARCRRPL